MQNEKSNGNIEIRDVSESTVTINIIQWAKSHYFLFFGFLFAIILIYYMSKDKINPSSSDKIPYLHPQKKVWIDAKDFCINKSMKDKFPGIELRLPTREELKNRTDLSSEAQGNILWSSTKKNDYEMWAFDVGANKEVPNETIVPAGIFCIYGELK
jgi:hypothetical protein